MEASEREHVSNIQVFELVLIIKKAGMCVVRVSFSQSDWFHGLKEKWNDTVWGNWMGYTTPFTLLKVTTTSNILTYTSIYSTSHRASIVVYQYLYSQGMLTKRLPPETANWEPPGGPNGSEQCGDNFSGWSGNGSRTTPHKNSPSMKRVNQYHPVHGYSYTHSLQPFPCTLQFNHHSPFNVTPNSSQPAISVSHRFPTDRPHQENHLLLRVIYHRLYGLL